MHDATFICKKCGKLKPVLLSVVTKQGQFCSKWCRYVYESSTNVPPTVTHTKGEDHEATSGGSTG
jgi:hypothetical protein